VLLARLGDDARFRLLAADASYGLLASDTTAPPPVGARPALVTSRTPAAVEIVVEVVGPTPAPPAAGGRPCVAVRWVRVGGRDRGSLTTFLSRVLGVPARPGGHAVAGLKVFYDPSTHTVQADAGPGPSWGDGPSGSGRHASAQGLHRPSGIGRRAGTGRRRAVRPPPGFRSGRGAAATPPPRAQTPPPEPTGPDGAAGIHYGLQTDARELARVRFAGSDGTKHDGQETLGREGPRPKPVFKRPQTRGEYRWDGVTRRMVFGWVGETHCLFVIAGTNPPPLDTKVEVAVPTEPLREGSAWVTGFVSQLTIDHANERTKIELDLTRPGANAPSIYRQLVRNLSVVK